jgi:hypothetical protein
MIIVTVRYSPLSYDQNDLYLLIISMSEQIQLLKNDIHLESLDEQEINDTIIRTS